MVIISVVIKGNQIIPWAGQSMITISHRAEGAEQISYHLVTQMTL